MKRRTFIQQSVAATTMAAAAPQIIAGMRVRANSPVFSFSPNVLDDNDNILIIIQLFGGNDALNTVVPVADDMYYTMRPTLAVQKKDAWQWLGTDMYFHPALVKNAYQNGFGGLMDAGRLAVIQDVGYEQPNLSHFRSTDIWLSGINNSDPTYRLDEGWIGRYFERALPDFPNTLPEHPLCVQIGGSLSLLFQSQRGDMGIALTDPQKFFDLGQGLSPDEDYMTDQTPYAEEFNFIRTIAAQSDSYSQVVLDAYKKGVNKENYGTTGLAAQLGLIARLISGGLKSKVYMVSIGGFDTHVQQQDATDPTKGIHPSLMAQIANGVSRFMSDALQQGFSKRVAGLTVSEFGRRPYENGSRGTDHGAAGVQFVFGDGNNIRSSRYGNAPDLKDVDKNGDVVYQTDYRRIYADILMNWFNASEDDMRAILKLNANDTIAPLNVFIKRTTDVRDVFNGMGENAIAVHPNPSWGDVTVTLELAKPDDVRVSVFNSRGQLVRHIHEGVLMPGRIVIPANIATSGQYLCVVNAGGRMYQKPFTVVR